MCEKNTEIFYGDSFALFGCMDYRTLIEIAKDRKGSKIHPGKSSNRKTTSLFPPGDERNHKK